MCFWGCTAYHGGLDRTCKAPFGKMPPSSATFLLFTRLKVGWKTTRDARLHRIGGVTCMSLRTDISHLLNHICKTCTPDSHESSLHQKSQLWAWQPHFDGLPLGALQAPRVSPLALSSIPDEDSQMTSGQEEGAGSRRRCFSRLPAPRRCCTVWGQEPQRISPRADDAGSLPFEDCSCWLGQGKEHFAFLDTIWILCK